MIQLCGENHCAISSKISQISLSRMVSFRHPNYRNKLLWTDKVTEIIITRFRPSSQLSVKSVVERAVYSSICDKLPSVNHFGFKSGMFTASAHRNKLASSLSFILFKNPKAQVALTSGRRMRFMRTSSR